MRAPALVLLLALALAACDNTVDPFADDPPARLSVAGFLDADADTQFVRVDALRETVEGAAARPALAVATHPDDGGAAVAWRDSLVRLDDGTTGRLFWAPFRPRPGVGYTLVVEGAGGRAEAFTEVPGPLPVTLGDVVDTTGAGLRQRVTWLGLREAPEAVLVSYVVQPPDAPRDTVALSYTPLGTGTPGGLAFNVLLGRDRGVILTRLDRPPQDSTVALVEIHMAIRRLSDAWRGGGAPIEGGFGFFGSAATVATRWSLPPADAARLGYRSEE